MPKVGTKKFSYTKAGKTADKKYAKRTGKNITKKKKTSSRPKSHCPPGYVQLPSGACVKKRGTKKTKRSVKKSGSNY